ncbi:hypothetical protein ACMAUO_06945 [Gluconacetobacter sp. Hr-1-5]|uniref:hypothetical protein n=1 Tax=Gluconacetobacter sp. Hr-1-5 TaxID=3395370 RepID=UPI003B52005E
MAPLAGLRRWGVGPAGAPGLEPGECLLVRPDGYVGAVVPLTERDRLEPYLAGMI